MKFSDLPKQALSHLVKPAGVTLEEWQVMLRMQQAIREDFDVECVSERYNPGEYRVRSRKTGGVYKVVYRGPGSPWNYCDCMDFKTSQLGTCKHVEGARKWIADHHKRIHWDLPAYTSVYLSYRGTERRVCIRIGEDCQAQFTALAARYFDDLGTLRPEAFDIFGQFLAEARAIDSSFRCYSDVLDFILEQCERKHRQEVVDEKYDDAALDSLLHTKLYPYQREGVRFAVKAGRCILADEMGLGKTVLAIAAAELLRREHLVGSVIVMCPTTLKYQWQREIERFTDARAIVVEGTESQREQLMEEDAPYKVLSYNTFLQMNSLRSTDMLILDEVQRLKNWNTQVAKAVRRVVSRYSMILSGTPLENRLEELYSIVELVDQFLLSPYYLFRDRYLLTDETGRTTGYRNLNEIGQRVAPILLRRRKADVALQLPPRIDKNLFVPMTSQQMQAHNALRTQAARMVAKWRRQHFLSEGDRKGLMLTLSQMRMTCDSLYVLDEQNRYDTKVEETMNILSGCPADAKVVIFSQWERMTRLVAMELDRSGVEYVYIHGNVPSGERRSRIEEFSINKDIRVFLSTDTGSVGLNLQVATLVINLDLPWNPAVLEQRIGRIHRIGQTRGVEVVNLISAGTIEEEMLTKLHFKQALFEGALDGGGDTVLLTDEHFQDMLTELGDSLDTSLQQTPALTPSREEENSASLENGSEDTPAPSGKALLNSAKQEDGNDGAPLLQRLSADMAALLLADEATRRRAAELLRTMIQ